MKEQENTICHESFGQISFSRVSSTGDRFYGSELMQHNYISMELKGSEMTRKLNTDWFSAAGKPLIVRLRMTSGQFAEMITGMNRGDGVPCTIEYANFKKMEPIPDVDNRKELIHKEFENRAKEFAETLVGTKNKAKEIVKKKTLTKNDVEELSRSLDWIITEIASNMPYIAKCFQETMDNIVHDAKNEVENAIQHKINVLGLAALHEQNKLLEK